MRASPYDLSSYGFMPIRIETKDGREEYVEYQKQLRVLAGPIRERLLEEYHRFVSENEVCIAALTIGILLFLEENVNAIHTSIGGLLIFKKPAGTHMSHFGRSSLPLRPGSLRVRIGAGL